MVVLVAESGSALANREADIAFQSTTFQRAMAGLSARVAEGISAQVELISQESATTMLMCIKDFIAGRYGQAVEAAFGQELLLRQASLNLNPLNPDIQVMPNHNTAVAGIAVIIASHIATRIATTLLRDMSEQVAGQVASKLVGRAAGAVIPVVGWAVGLGLIAWDLVEGKDGALPMIQTALSSEEIAAEIRGDLLSAISSEVQPIRIEAAAYVADEVYKAWQDFSLKFSSLLSFAERQPSLQAFLTQLAPESFYQLAQLYELLGEETLLRQLDNGNLAAMVMLPESSLTMLREGYAVEEILLWWALAGGNFDKVVSLGVYRFKQPSELSQVDLGLLLGLEPPTITTLAQLDSPTLSLWLNTTPPNTLNRLAKELDSSHFHSLSDYLNTLDSQSREVFLSSLSVNPSLSNAYAEPSVKKLISQSADPVSTLRFIASERSTFNLWQDARDVFKGIIPFKLFVAKYQLDLRGIYLVGFALVLLMIGIIARAFKPRRNNTSLKPFKI
ncbi:MAG: hypothetical protein R2865_03590 [Deinococcales bacterium]